MQGYVVAIGLMGGHVLSQQKLIRCQAGNIVDFLPSRKRSASASTTAAAVCPPANGPE